jgi:molybdate-binding protein
MELSEDLRKKIELVIGRKLLPDEQGGVNGFLGFSKEDIAEIHLLEQRSGVLAISYIRYRLKAEVTLDQVVSYYGSVIQQGLAVEEWLNN